MKNKTFRKVMSVMAVITVLSVVVSGCGSSNKKSEGVSESATEDIGSAGTNSDGKYFDADATVEEVLTKASKEGKIGNWGGGSEYEVLALLSKYGLDTSFLSQAYDMEGFDDDSILLASVMTYNEKGLVMNDYEGALGYGDSVKVIDFNEEGVPMLEDNLICTKKFAEQNPNTVKAFVDASMKGWKYACENPEEAAEIVFNNGSSISPDHQLFMAEEVKKLVETDTNGEKVTEYGHIDKDAMQGTLDIFRTYVTLEDSTANDALKNMTLDDFVDSTYWEDAVAGNYGALEKTDVTIQLKWLPQCQFMGYYVAKDKGYYDEVGLNVTITPGGGDIGETTAVFTGQADFATTWPGTLISANASGMGLLEVAQVYQSSGMQLIYKVNK